MRLVLACLVVGAASLFMSQHSASAVGGAEGGGGPPIVVPGARVVELRNATGGLSMFTSIPQGSVFRSHGGAGAPCSFSSSLPGTTSDGRPYLPDEVVQSHRWIFHEETWIFWRPTPPEEPTVGAPLAGARRWFKVFCDVKDNYHFIAYRSVPVSDPMIDPHSQLTRLYGRLQLTRPVVRQDPVVDQWGGLVVRHPAWLGIDPAAWAPQVTAPAMEWRGWVMDLVARPAELSFEVDFVPNPDKPSPPFHGIVPCIAAGEGPVTAPTGAAVFPVPPELPEQTEPGVNGPCTWTPPGPGTVTIQARITFAVTFRASGYVEERPDYVWTSEPVTFPTGELTSVNLDPTG